MSTNRSASIEQHIRRRPWLVAAIAALIGVLLAAGYLDRREDELLHIAEPQAVVVARAALAPGAMIDADDLASARLPRRFVPPGAITDADDAVGRIAAVAMPKGTVLTAAMARTPGAAGALAAAIPAGARAVALPVEGAAGLLRLIHPGDRVDLMATFDLDAGGAERRTTMTILENVPVLACDGHLLDAIAAAAPAGRVGLFNTRAPVSTREISTLVVAVSPEAAQRVAFAQQTGVLAVSVRAFGDEEGEGETLPTTIASMTGKFERVLPMQKRFREYRGR